jgi:UPF0716 family protein affecting phage T7 exclusion
MLFITLVESLGVGALLLVLVAVAVIAYRGFHIRVTLDDIRRHRNNGEDKED